MPQYLLSMYQPEGVLPHAELAPIMDALGALVAEMRAEGSWVFSGGLTGQGSATVVRSRDGEALLTDGPFAEAKEFVGGLTIITAPDLDAAIGWAGRISAASTLPVEVRPFRGA